MRTTIISTSKLKIYKILAVSMIIGLSSFLIGFTTYRIIFLHVLFEALTMLVWIVILYRAVHVVLKIKSVSFDESSVYYVKRGFEVQIPFVEIKDIEIKTISGIYKINLLVPNQDGNSIMFKTSLWYPLNFKKQDEEVNVLRDKIDNYKRRISPKNLDQLSSFQLNIE